MDKRKKRIGIMGGTFDPIHIGHLILGETAYEQFQLDEVLFMPSGNPPHKRNRAHRATDDQRCEMVKRAIASNPHFSLSLEEMNEDGFTRNHTKEEALDETISYLTKKYNGSFKKLKTLNIDISSALLRSWVAGKRNIRYYIPDSVIEYIKQNHIYEECDEHAI